MGSGGGQGPRAGWTGWNRRPPLSSTPRTLLPSSSHTQTFQCWVSPRCPGPPGRALYILGVGTGLCLPLGRDQYGGLYLSFSMWGLLTHQEVSLPPLCLLRGDKRKVEPCLGTKSCLHMYSLHCDPAYLGGRGRPRVPRKHSLGQALAFLNFRGSRRKEGSRAFPQPLYPTSTPSLQGLLGFPGWKLCRGCGCLGLGPGVWVSCASPSSWEEVWGPLASPPCPVPSGPGAVLSQLSLHGLACWGRSKRVCRCL